MSTSPAAAFISYSREDSEFALRVARDLKAAGASIWLDQLDIKPGLPWDNAIEEALIAAPQMLVVLSPTSARSENVRNEISYALEQGKIVVPVLYMDCIVPLRLQRAQRIDFRADYARGLKSLLTYLGVKEPVPEVIREAEEGDVLRQAAWQAREAESQRLREVAEQKARDVAESPQSPLPGAADPSVPTFALLTEPEKRWLPRIHGDDGRPAWSGIAARIVVPLLAAAILATAIVLLWMRHSNSNPRAVSVPQQTAAVTQPPPAVTQPLPPVRNVRPPARPNEKTRDRTNIPASKPPISAQPAPTGNENPQPPPPAPTPAELCQQADALYSQNNFAAAAPLYERSCVASNGAACRQLGWMHQQGQGYPQDPAEARRLFQIACNLGDAFGCNDLAALLAAGNGGARDSAGAVTYYTKACNAGLAPACQVAQIAREALQSPPSNAGNSISRVPNIPSQSYGTLTASGDVKNHTITLTHSAPFADRQAIIRAPGRGLMDYNVFTIDTRDFTEGGVLDIEIQIAPGSGTDGSFDLFPLNVPVPVQGRPVGTLAGRYDVRRGTTTHLDYRFRFGQIFNFGLEGNWFSAQGATGMVRFRASVRQ